MVVTSSGTVAYVVPLTKAQLGGVVRCCLSSAMEILPASLHLVDNLSICWRHICVVETAVLAVSLFSGPYLRPQTFFQWPAHQAVHSFHSSLFTALKQMSSHAVSIGSMSLQTTSFQVMCGQAQYIFSTGTQWSERFALLKSSMHCT